MKKVNLKDIAEYVGVSTALVSYVLNGQAVEKQVNKSTAERIIKAAQKFNYQTNQIAKSLKTQKTHTIGLVVADINFRFSTGITKSIEEEAKKNNYTVIYGSSNEDAEKFAKLINVFVNRRVDGLILVPTEGSENEIEVLQRSGIPFVLVDRHFPEIQCNYISLDNYKAAYNATQYLIDKGHRRIAFVNYRTTLFHLLERNKGYADALKQNNINFEEFWLQQIDSVGENDVTTCIELLMKAPMPCDAIFFATDILAINGLKYLSNKKINVPEQISVLSFDESESFDLFYTPITFSRQPLMEMGCLAVNNLMELMNGSDHIKQISLEAKIISGASCREQ
ncbi:substrate-binding domain-containing protein [Pedobacter sp. B4-66]|uniref:LacI family DNA-binding transcriptional regulator n=1 Tax=Pedobacter sp. B4-66 TaxID=2817280 RepID=UPI001BDA4E39|nr:substrate-binding domain-containing protein [Pedobacter sp. B4-66]